MDTFNNKDGLNTLLDSLVTYTKLYHKPYSKESLIFDLPIKNGEETPQLFSLNESKALFSRAAQHAGLKTKIIQRKIEDISNLQLPIILLLNNNKAVIFDSFSNDRKQLKLISELDGEITEQWFDIEHIKQEYIGFAIMLKKSFDFNQKNGHHQTDFNVKHWFWSTLKLSKNIYKDVFFASLLINMFVLATPLFTMSVYDRVIPNNATETLWFFAIGVALVYTLDTFLKFIRAYFLEIAAKKSDIIMSSIIFEKVLGIKMESLPKSIGAFANNIKDFDMIRTFLTNATLIAFIDLPFSLIFLFVIYYIGGIIVLIPLIIMGIILCYAYLIKTPLQNSIKSSHKAAAHKNSILIETLNNIETLKSLGTFGSMQWSWEESSGEIAKRGLKSRILSSSIPTVTGLLVQLNTVCVIIVGVYLIQEFELTMGGLIACVILTSRAVAPMGQAAALMTNYEDANNAYSMLNEIMEKPVERPKNKNFVTHSDLKGKIEFKNVTFVYPETDIVVLDNVSFTINPGEHVAILGKIGSGKSTILKLILKLYEPTSGSIFIDDIDLKQIDPADIRKKVGYVSQHVSLLNGTVKENITYKATYVDDQTMIKAAEVACVDDFVNRHPRGYDMPIGENGAGLSGGQIQSIGLARAVLFPVPMMLLDEPSNSMDQMTEKKVLEHLNEFLKDKTMLLITQKMSFLSIADRVIVLNNAQIYLDGKKEAVIGRLNGKGVEDETKH